MKVILITTFLMLYNGLVQNQNQKAILEKFIIAHNQATEAAVKRFIKEAYHPSMYSKIDLAKHVAFYNQIIEEFGPLNTHIYEKVEESDTKLIVHLIKDTESLMNKNIDPAEILVVEIDLSHEDPKYIERGLGLGALICEIKR